MVNHLLSPSIIVPSAYLLLSVCSSANIIDISLYYHPINLLSLQPTTLPIRPWTWLAFPFIDTIPLLFILQSVSLFMCLRYFERCWDRKSVVKFLLGTTLFSTLLIFVASWSMYWTLGLHVDRMYGILTVLSAFIVAFKHIIPEHLVKVLTTGFRVKHIPFSWLVVHTVTLLLFGLTYWPVYLLVVSGFVSSWWYLRFVKIENGIRGDRSDAFSFQAFLPDKLQPLFQPVLSIIFVLFVRVRLISQSPTRVLELDNRNSSRIRGGRRFVASPPKPVLPVSLLSAKSFDRRK